MRDNPNITTAELHNILGVSETAVEKNISFLRDNGYIERVGSKRQGTGKYCKCCEIMKRPYLYSFCECYSYAF